MVDGELRYRGHVGSDLSEKEGYEAAKLCAINVLAQIKAVLGSFDRLEMLIRFGGYVNSAPGWSDQPKVIKGASDLFGKVLGQKAGHARIGLGHNELTVNAAVKVAAVIAAKD